MIAPRNETRASGSTAPVEAAHPSVAAMAIDARISMTPGTAARAHPARDNDTCAWAVRRSKRCDSAVSALNA
jgi:hypothetical protein